MIRPRLVFWFFTLAACFIANQLIQHRYLMILMLFLLVLPIFSVLYSYWIRRNLAIDIQTENDFIERGENAVWFIRFENLSKIQGMVIRVMIKSNTFSLDQEQMKASLFISQNDYQIIRLTAKPSYSGPFTAESLSVSVNDIFGFFSLKLFSAKELNFPNIYVLPLGDTDSNYKDYLSNQLEAGQLPAGKNQILQDEFDRFREMENGDSLKLIHWKLSARMQEWIVKEFEKEDERSVTVILNLPEVFFKTLNKESDRLLKLRNFILDHTYTAIQIFLSRRATVRLKTYQPELAVEEAQHMNEADLLRKQLAFIPYRTVVPFHAQLEDEQLGNEQNILYILTHELNDNLVDELRALRIQIGGMLLVFAVDSNQAIKEAEEHIQKLEDLDISVEIAKSHEVNLYE
ncbi:MAG TPA: DUF58 domain-containing protein [Candidatus Eisenbacteria bacterium]|nr:DUF58 domain-containing protein [Candidatus Eisenbacteria bacterium]